MGKILMLQEYKTLQSSHSITASHWLYVYGQRKSGPLKFLSYRVAVVTKRFQYTSGARYTDVVTL